MQKSQRDVTSVFRTFSIFFSSKVNMDEVDELKKATFSCIYHSRMNKNKPRRNFIKKNLALFFSFSLLNLNLITYNLKSGILRKKRNFIWYLNKND